MWCIVINLGPRNLSHPEPPSELPELAPELQAPLLSYVDDLSVCATLCVLCVYMRFVRLCASMCVLCVHVSHLVCFLHIGVLAQWLSRV